MSDFVQTMKDWKRMCEAKVSNSMCNPNNCELYKHFICGAIFDVADASMYAEVENVVTKWAKDHPEPTYPTWAEWLSEQRVLTSPIPVANMTAVAYFGGLRSQDPIPEEMAKKLDIKPKNMKDW